jgi:hypothetical protein
VLGAVVMLLQRQLAAGHHHDALDLEALAAVDRLVIAPGTMNAAMLDRLHPALALQLGNQPLRTWMKRTFPGRRRSRSTTP